MAAELREKKFQHLLAGALPDESDVVKISVDEAIRMLPPHLSYIRHQPLYQPSICRVQSSD